MIYTSWRVRTFRNRYTMRKKISIDLETLGISDLIAIAGAQAKRRRKKTTRLYHAMKMYNAPAMR